jgi:pseudomonalisin
MMARSLRTRLSLLATAALLVLTSDGFAQNVLVAAHNRVVSPIVESDVVTMAGNLHPMARPEFDRGPLSDETRLDRIVLLMQPDAEQQKTLDALVQAQHDPKSPSYHQWISAQEYGSRFGASAADLAKVTGWLTGHGFTVEPIPAGHRAILFSGTVAQVADTFHTEIHRFTVGSAMHIANTQDPQIPSALAPVVAGILSLHDFRRSSAIRSIRQVTVPEPAIHLQSNPENTQGGSHYLFPADYATIYDLNPQYSAGRSGNGVSIAIVGRSNINLSDVSSFRSTAGLSANQPTVILEGANPGLVSDDQDESTLDVEWSGATAPAASVKFVVAASTSTTDGVDLSAQYIVNHQTATVMSTSYGSCEAYMGSGELAFYNSLWEQAASEGISSFVSSGDSGAAGCNAGSSTSGSMAGVNGLCSSPYSTCVGGTEFNEGSGSYWSASNGAGNGSALSYIPEKIWNESASDGGSGLWASTGGISEVYTQPIWQEGVPGANSNGKRSVPDVALTAASHDGYLICENGSFYVIAGTSAASPSFAGIMAIVDQKQGGVGQGNANPTLYALLDASQNPFHATPTGNNSVPGVTGFTASGAAYNLATGLGSVDANVLVNEWPASGTSLPQKGIMLTPSVSSILLVPGTTATFTVAVAGTGNYSGTVTLKATAPSGVTVSLSAASVKTGSSATFTVTAPATASAISGTIAISGASGTFTASASEAVTVTAPTLTLKPSASSVSVLQGKTATFAVALSATGGYSQPVTLHATVPSGVTVSFNPASLKPGASAAATVTASSMAIAGAGSIAISATSGSFTGTTSEPVTVVRPALTLKTSTASVSVFEGQTATFSVAVSAAAGFTDAVALKATAPNGVAVIFNPTSVKPGASATVTVSATTSAPGATGSIAITGASGSFTGSATEPVTVAAPVLTLHPSVSTLSVAQAKTATFAVAVTASSGFTQPVALHATEPSGVTVSFNPATVKPGTSSTATVSVSATATPGTGNIVIAGTSGNATQSATTSLTVLATPTLSMTAAATKVQVVQGKTATLQVTTTTGGSFSGSVALAVAGLPTGVTASWSPATFSRTGAGSTISTLTLRAATTATVTTGTLQISASGDNLKAQTTSAVQVLIAPAVSLALSPATINMQSTAIQHLTVTVTPIGGVMPSTSSTFQVTGLPTGIAASWGTPALTATGTLQATLTLTGSSIAVSSASKPTVTTQVHDSATEAVYMASVQAALTVTKPATLAASAAFSTLNIGKGKSVVNSITISTSDTFHTAVSFAISGLPTGVSASWSVNPVIPAGDGGLASTTLMLKAASTAPLASRAVTITATGGGLSVTRNITVQVTN